MTVLGADDDAFQDKPLLIVYIIIFNVIVSRNFICNCNLKFVIVTVYLFYTC